MTMVMEKSLTNINFLHRLCLSLQRAWDQSSKKYKLPQSWDVNPITQWAHLHLRVLNDCAVTTITVQSWWHTGLTLLHSRWLLLCSRISIPVHASHVDVLSDNDLSDNSVNSADKKGQGESQISTAYFKWHLIQVPSVVRIEGAIYFSPVKKQSILSNLGIYSGFKKRLGGQ